MLCGLPLARRTRSQGRRTLPTMSSQSDQSTSLSELAASIRAAWGPDTAAQEAWSESLPEKGQCAVTALVVQDVFGGDLLRAEVSGESHYWNRLSSGDEIDFTRGQFEAFSPGPIEMRSRGYVLSFPDTFRRYLVLRERVHKLRERAFAGSPECP